MVTVNIGTFVPVISKHLDHLGKIWYRRSPQNSVERLFNSLKTVKL